MYEKYRIDDIKNHIDRVGFQPLDIMVTGATGAGKSSTLNGFFDKVVAKVGDGVDPETMNLEAYSLTEKVRFWDTPGLGDGFQKDNEHSQKITELLQRTHHDEYYFLDMVVIILEAGSRDIGTTIKLIDQVIKGRIPADRILIALNQADFAMKGNHWDENLNMPDPVLYQYLEEKSVSLQRRIYESTGLNVCKPVFYSARYNYNVDGLYDLIIDHMPDEPRRISAEI